MAARPAAHSRKVTILSAAGSVPGRVAAASRVSKPNRTVDRIRAQDRPRLFAHAIQSHRPPAISPLIAPPAIRPALYAPELAAALSRALARFRTTPKPQTRARPPPP